VPPAPPPLRDDRTAVHADSCTGTGEAGLLLHALVVGTGVERRRDGKEHERTLFLDAVAAAASTLAPDTKPYT
jgi:hypothetical protein